jgi:hypothetical protein
VIKRDQKDSLRFAHFLHFSEQYFTLAQSLAHFFRHSKGRAHFSQVLGSNPFFVFAVAAMLQGYDNGSRP